VNGTPPPTTPTTATIRVCAVAAGLTTVGVVALVVSAPATIPLAVVSALAGLAGFGVARLVDAVRNHKSGPPLPPPK
jgi:hypothetical protein